jgi:hypothetical protein
MSRLQPLTAGEWHQRSLVKVNVKKVDVVTVKVLIPAVGECAYCFDGMMIGEVFGHKTPSATASVYQTDGCYHQ